MDAFPGRVQDDDVRGLRQGIQHFQDVPRDKAAVRDAVAGCVLPCGIHRFRDDLHAHGAAGSPRHQLGNGPGAAVEIKHSAALRLPGVLPHLAVEKLRPSGIVLEKGEGRDPEPESGEDLLKIFASPEKRRPLVDDCIRKRIVSGMQDPGDGAFRFERKDPLLPCREQMVPRSGGGHQDHQDLPAPGPAPYHKMAEIAVMAGLVIIRDALFRVEIQRGLKDPAEILVHQPAAVRRHDVVVASAPVHAQRQRAVPETVPEAVLHLHPVALRKGTRDQTFPDK